MTPLAARARFASAGLAASAAFCVVAAGVCVQRWAMWSARLDRPSAVDQNDIDGANVRMLVVIILFPVLYVVTGVAFVAWQRGHSRNAQALGARGLGPVWAVGGWFVPCAFPALPAIELHQSSRASRWDEAPPARRRPAGRAGAALVAAWAACLGVGMALVSAGPILTSRFDDLSQEGVEQKVQSDRTFALGFLVLAAAAVLGLAVVRTLTERQACRLAGVTAAAAVVPTGGAQPGEGSVAIEGASPPSGDVRPSGSTPGRGRRSPP